MAKTASPPLFAAAFLLLIPWAAWPCEARGQAEGKSPSEAAPIKPRVLDACFIAFSPDGKSYVTEIGKGPAALYDSATGKEIRRFNPRSDACRRALFSPDGKMLLLTGSYKDRYYWLVDLESGKEIRPLEDCYQEMALRVADCMP